MDTPAVTVDASAHIEPRSEEGSTPAAWTTVIIMLVAFVIGTLGVCLAQPMIFWGAVVLLVLGGVVGKVMASMGYGQYPNGKAAPAHSDEEPAAN